MAEIVISIAAKVAELLVVPIGKHICYPFKCQSNIDGLKKQVEKLKDVREMVQHSVDEAKKQGDEIEKVVEKWLNRVNDFTQGVENTIIDDEDNAKKRCFMGLCPNLMTRYSLSKKAARMTKDGVVLLGEGKFEKYAYRPPLQKTASIFIGEYEDFNSRKLISNDLMEALRNADVNLIGVYGMGGVGKTTLIKKVAWQVEVDKLFDVVVMVEVTETPDIRNIQGQIADELGLKFQEESLPGRAARLRERMKKENRILVILDNIWAKLDLKSIGIPVGGDEKGSTTQKADHEGENANKRQCKILFTSRNLDVLRNDMDIRKNFKVDILSDAESKSLFWKTVGYSEDKSDLNRISDEIVEKCAGLPVAIKTIANALKNKSLPFWKNALDQLKKANPKNIKGMNADVYSTIELSYNFLESEEAKSLFILCSLCDAGHGFSIHDLLKYGMGLGLFQDVYTIEEGRNKLHMLINDLKTSCLLMDGYVSFIKMHDIIRAVAISIAATTKLSFNIQDVAGLKELLEEKLPKDSVAISLPHVDVHEIPEKLEFPKLELFLLFLSDSSLRIPDAFFEGMKGLKVLDMSGIHFLSLPSSLCCLTNLRSLSLDRSRLGDVAIIGKLKKLEFLSFGDSHIEQLPEEIKLLTRLRLLDLRYCAKLKVIKPNVISSLTQLEELLMSNSFDQWEVEGGNNASLAELKQLSRLTTLEIDILDAHIIPQDSFFGKLERYKIIIGHVQDQDRFDSYGTSRTLKLNLGNRIYLGNGVKILLNRTENLYLDGLKGVKNFLYELEEEGFPQLKHLHVQNGPEIQYIINSVGFGPSTFFPKLESLFLYNLINLEKMCHGQLATEAFMKLRIVKVGRCDSLKNLFSFSMAKNLLKLQEIEVTNCEKLEEIVFKESHEQFQQHNRVSSIEFTQLRTLRLKCLPRLTSFGFKEFTPDIVSQEIVAEDEADGLMSLFSQNVVLPILKNLELSSINIGCTRLDQLLAMSSCCQTLTSLTLEDCSGNLKFLFSYSKVKSLVLLENLVILNCNSIEEIINTEELKEGKVIKMVFPKLINLRLKGLPNLTQFGSRNSFEFPSLTEVSVQNCPRLKIFFSASASASADLNFQDDIETISNALFPNLNELELIDLQELTSFCNFVGNAIELPSLTSLWIKNCPNMQTFISNSTGAGMSTSKDNLHTKIQPLFDEKVQLPNLKNLLLEDMDNVLNVFPSNMFGRLQNLLSVQVLRCDSLKSIFPASIASSLLQLEELKIEDCCMLEEIVAKEDEVDEAVPRFVFPQLTWLELFHLSGLKSFYPGLHISEWPVLKFLQVWQCDNVETFSLESSSFQATNGESQHEMQRRQHLFSVDKVPFTNLESLALEWNLADKEVLLEKLPEYSCRLKVLGLRGFHKETDICVSCFLHKLPNLEELGVHRGFFKEIFLYEGLGCEENHVEAPSKLSYLRIHGVSDSLHLWEENSLTSKVFQNLATLEVECCGNIKSLVPSLVSFQNLTTLRVSYCDSLLSLVTLSTAKSFVQLVTLSITECQMIKEVITHEGDEVEDQIIFKNLIYLTLDCLPSLTSFNSGKYTIEFPYLHQVIVRQCLNMKIFSEGDLSTPWLHKLQTAVAEEGFWKGNLNTTVEHLFLENSQNSKED